MTISSAISDRDRVLAATDMLAIVGEVVALRPKGREHLGLCPFHDDRSPSLAVVTHKGTGFYKCFACGAAGNAIDFVMNYHRMEFPEALRFLAERANVELTPYRPTERARREGEPTRDEILRANQLAERFFRRVYADADAGARARAEIERRGFSHETVEAFGIGAAPARGDALVEGVQQAIRKAGSDYPPFDAFVAAGVIRPGRNGHVDLLRDRLVFPIRDELGRPIAFGGRKLDPEQEPKYLNSPESPVFHKSRALYGIDRAKRAIVTAGASIVTEGYTDVIACHRAGFTNAVATLGTAFTRDHARALRRLSERVVLLFDGDEAGQKAADRALDLLMGVYLSESVDIRICVLPDGLDPDDLLRQEGGPERFRTALARASDALPFMASRIRRKIDGRGLSGRQQEIEQTLAKLVDSGLNAMHALRRQLVMQTLAEIFALPAIDLDRLARNMKPRDVPARPSASAGAEVEVKSPDLRTAGGPDSASRVVPVPTSTSSTTSPTSTTSAGAPSELAERAELADGTHAGPSDPGSSPFAVTSAVRRRARHDAERRLLSLLCCDPALVSIAVPVDGGERLPLSEAASPGEFTTPGYAAIFAAIRDAAESARVLSFEALLGELASPELKRLASDLHLFGTDLFRNVTSPSSGVTERRSVADEIAASWHDLEKLERRHRFQDDRLQGGSDPRDAGSGQAGAALDPQSALERLARLRERGHDATAVSNLFRRRPGAAPDTGRSST